MRSPRLLLTLLALVGCGVGRLVGGDAGTNFADGALSADADGALSGDADGALPGVADGGQEARRDSGPLVYLKFGEAAGATVFANSARPANDATCQGQECPTAEQPGKQPGFAARFNPQENDYLRVAGSGTELEPSPEVSVSAYVKVEATGPQGGEVISMGDSFVLRIASNGSPVTFFWDGTTFVELSATGSVIDGKWHHLLAQKTANELQIWKDGSKTASLAASGAVVYAGHGLGDILLGRNAYAEGVLTYNFGGLMDEVRIFGRALDSPEIAALQQATCGDGLADFNEACDGSDLAGKGCLSVPGSFTGGTLRCSSCAFDTSSCTTGGTPGFGIYGNAFGYEDQTATPPGGYDSYGSPKGSYRFRAGQSSALNTIRVYMQGPTQGGMYGAGTGGTARFTIQTDDGSTNHFPTGTVLATEDVVHPDNRGGPQLLVTFASPANLTAGTLYHMVFSNTDSSPTTNYYSLNGAMRYFPESPQRHPKWPDTDWALLVYNYIPHSGWWERTNIQPIMDIGYANGVHEGMGYHAPDYGAGHYGIITGVSSMTRERFSVGGGDRTVAGVGLRVLRDSTTGTDPLLVRLEDNGGALIDSVSIAAASFGSASDPSNNSPGGRDGRAVWLKADFASSHVLMNAQTYRVRLSCAATTTYYSFSLEKGTAYGYDPQTFFADGVAEKTTNGSTWTSHGTDHSDLQLYLVTAQ